MSLATGYIGHVATALSFVLVGYEPRTARSSNRMSVDAGHRLVEVALEDLEQVAPDAPS